MQLENIYITRIKPHFHCGLNIAAHPQLQLALRAIEGLDVNTLSELEKEHAAKAIECGYLYREGEMLYTKILVSSYRIHVDSSISAVSLARDTLKRRPRLLPKSCRH